MLTPQVLRRLLPHTPRATLEQHAAMFDVDHTGSVSLAQFRASLDRLGLLASLRALKGHARLTEAHEGRLLRMYFAELAACPPPADTAPDAELGLDVAAVMRIVLALKPDLPQEQCALAAATCDADGSGSVSFTELKHVVETLQLFSC